MGKLNNRQRKEFCTLVDSKNTKAFDDLNQEIEDSLQKTADHIIKTDKTYKKLAADYVKVSAAEKKLGKELKVLDNKSRELETAIGRLGINTRTNELLVDRVNQKYNNKTKQYEWDKVPSTENGLKVLNGIKSGILTSKAGINRQH